MEDKLHQNYQNMPGRPAGLGRAGRLMLGARSEGQAKVLRQAGVGGAVDGESHWPMDKCSLQGKACQQPLSGHSWAGLRPTHIVVLAVRRSVNLAAGIWATERGK